MEPESRTLDPVWLPETSPDRSPVSGARSLDRLMLRVVCAMGVVAALAATVSCVGTIAGRIPSPYPVEWQEGVVVNHSLRVLDGAPIYTRPSASFIPILYPPFGYVVQAGAMRLLGRGLPAARAASAAASMGIALLIAWVVYRQTRSRLATILAVGLYFAAYTLCFAYYDQARIDMVFVLLALLALVLLDQPRLSARRVIAAGMLVSLATLTKQHGLAFAGAGFGYLLLRAPRLALVFATAFGVVLIPIVLVLNGASDGWFILETWTFLHRFSLHWHYLPRVIEGMIALAVPLGCAALWVLDGLRRGEHRRLTSIWTVALAAAAFSGYTSLLHPGATTNHLIPILVIAVIMQGFLIGSETQNPSRHRLAVALVALALMPFAIWPWPARATLPPAVCTAQAESVAGIAAIPGDVLVLEDPYYGWLAGKSMNADGASLLYLSDLGLDLPADLVQSITARRYGAVVLSYRPEIDIMRTRSGKELSRLITAHYTYSHSLVADGPLIDMLRIPRHIYLPHAIAGRLPAGALEAPVRTATPPELSRYEMPRPRG
jgi:hypothetical protein